MKKLCLSLGAIVLSGLVLASCSGVKINKPKSKGSAVDSISVTTSEGTFEFKKDDKFADVYSKLSSYQYFTIDNTLSGDNYEYAYKTKSSVSGKMTYTNYINEDNQYLYKKYVATAKQTYIEDNYFKSEEKDGNYKFFIKYTLICFAGLVIQLVKEFLIAYSNYRGTKNLHEDMISNIMNAPINLFHDILPIGQILNRLIHDLEKTEEII